MLLTFAIGQVKQSLSALKDGLRYHGVTDLADLLDRGLTIDGDTIRWTTGSFRIHVPKIQLQELAEMRRTYVETYLRHMSPKLAEHLDRTLRLDPESELIEYTGGAISLKLH